MAIAFGRCPCTGLYQRRFVEVRFKGQLLQNIPQGYCPQCGSRVYQAFVLRWLEAALQRSQLDALPGGSGQPAGSE
jgi:hypothetical protein